MKTTTGHNWSCGPMWVRQRSLGKNRPQRMQASHDLVRRLGLETTLGETSYYYYPEDWNQRGTLLATALMARTDARDFVGVWDVFKQREVCTMETGSKWNQISCVKFVPDNDTQVITSLSSGGLILLDIVKGENSHLSNDPCSDIAVHPSEPNLIWSVTQDSYVTCCDIRQAHTYAHKYKYRSAWCIAINPLHSEVLAVGLRYSDTLLIDRRALRSDTSSSCIARFQPVYQYNHRSLGLASLVFNSDGSELLVSIYGEQVYLFNTYEPWEKYRSFDLSIKPLLSDEPELIAPSTSPRLKPYSYLKELRKQCPVEIHDELKTLCVDILSRDSTFTGPSNIIDQINRSLEGELRPNHDLPSLQDENIIDYLNILLDKMKNCPDLYQARAIALMRRAHRGDYYQALRDCCCALVLKPLDFRTIRCLSTTLIKLKYLEDVCCLLDFVDDAIEEFGDHNDLTESREMLLYFKEMKENERTDVDQRTYSISSCTASSCSESAYSDSTHSESAHSESASPEPAHSVSNHGLEADSGSSMEIFDYSRRYRSTEKEFLCYGVNFFGSNDEFIIGGGEAAFHVWDKSTTNIVKTVDGRDLSTVLPHPSICMIATSGHSFKLWSPMGKESKDLDD